MPRKIDLVEFGAKAFIGLVIVGVTIFFIAFGIYLSNAPAEGEIVSLNYSEPYMTYSYATHDDMTCTTVPIRHNESFSVTINDSGEGWKNTISVPEFIWHDLKVGDYFDKNCLCVKGR